MIARSTLDALFACPAAKELGGPYKAGEIEVKAGNALGNNKAKQELSRVVAEVAQDVCTKRWASIDKAAETFDNGTLIEADKLVGEFERMNKTEQAGSSE